MIFKRKGGENSDSRPVKLEICSGWYSCVASLGAYCSFSPYVPASDSRPVKLEIHFSSFHFVTSYCAHSNVASGVIEVSFVCVASLSGVSIVASNAFETLFQFVASLRVTSDYKSVKGTGTVCRICTCSIMKIL